MTYTVDGVLTSWNDTTDYGISFFFRNMTDEEQRAEVLRLNKVAAKQMKGIIKDKLIAVNYTILVADKLLSTGKDLALNSYYVCGNYLNNRQRYFKYII
jgi:hypothetical protein